MNAPRRQLAPLITATVLMNIGLAAVASGAPVAQQASGHGGATVALAAAVSSLGTVVGALLAGRGHRRRGIWLMSLALLVVGAGIGSVVVGTAASLWIVPARVFDGLALGGALVASETLLLHAVDDTMRARAMALYGIATAAGFMVGPSLAGFVVGLGVGNGPFLVGVCGAVAASLVVLTLRSDPTTTTATTATTATTTATTTTTTTTWSTLWRRNIVPWSTTFHYGAFQGAALVVLPLRLLADGVDGAGATGIVAFYALGMLVMTWPVSLLGARFTTTTVMIVLCAIGGLAALSLAVVPLQALPVRALLAAVAGGTVATLSPLSLALQGQRNPASDIVRVNSLYNASYAAGMLFGPLLVAVSIQSLGVSLLLALLGSAWIAHAIWIFVVERVLRSSPSPSSSVSSSPSSIASSDPPPVEAA